LCPNEWMMMRQYWNKLTKKRDQSESNMKRERIKRRTKAPSPADVCQRDL
jgi:hypothetical protein